VSDVSSAALFSVLTGSPEPIYRQLIEQVRRLVAAGQLRAGDELPSVRELAQALAVNPMTVSRAWSQLEADGVVERRRGLGMAIAARTGAADTERARLLQPAMHAAAVLARQLGYDEPAATARFTEAWHGLTDDASPRNPEGTSS